jgi:hypothetical protein
LRRLGGAVVGGSLLFGVGRLRASTYTVLPNAGSLFAVLAGLMGCLAALPALIVVGAVGEGRAGPVVTAFPTS